MRRASRIDDNQVEITDYLLSIGASVASTHMVGDGFPDKVVGIFGLSFLCEIKDGDKPPSERRLTKKQRKFVGKYKGRVYVLKGVDDCERLMAYAIALKAAINRAGIWPISIDAEQYG